jgi:hypothetical protein
VASSASSRDAEARQRTAFSLGAQAYCFGLETLFQVIEAVRRQNIRDKG